MRWVRTAIGAVIAIAVVPIVVLTINEITGSGGTETGEIVISFDIIDNQASPNVYQSLTEFDINNDLIEVRNIDNTGFINVYDDPEIYELTFTNNEFRFREWLSVESWDLRADGSVNLPDSNLNGYTIELLLIGEIRTSTLPPTLITLLGLIPLILTSGILFSLYKRRQDG